MPRRRRPGAARSPYLRAAPRCSPNDVLLLAPIARPLGACRPSAASHSSVAPGLLFSPRLYRPLPRRYAPRRGASRPSCLSHPSSHQTLSDALRVDSPPRPQLELAAPRSFSPLALSPALAAPASRSRPRRSVSPARLGPHSRLPALCARSPGRGCSPRRRLRPRARTSLFDTLRRLSHPLPSHRGAPARAPLVSLSPQIFRSRPPGLYSPYFRVERPLLAASPPARSSSDRPASFRARPARRLSPPRHGVAHPGPPRTRESGPVSPRPRCGVISSGPPLLRAPRPRAHTIGETHRRGSNRLRRSPPAAHAGRLTPRAHHTVRAPAARPARAPRAHRGLVSPRAPPLSPTPQHPRLADCQSRALVTTLLDHTNHSTRLRYTLLDSSLVHDT
uniref:Uncharacterized protein n=1 Tax=Knipowitschia caucasica TaxID=637954 RepID=A0AAV2J3M8_KNICA